MDALNACFRDRPSADDLKSVAPDARTMAIARRLEQVQMLAAAQELRGPSSGGNKKPAFRDWMAGFSKSKELF
jgi:hypothetical protein